MSFRTLPASASKLPPGLSLEKPAKNLAALAAGGALLALHDVVLAQWHCGDRFAELAKHGIRPIDRLLFYGPPGNGKTMASQWLAAQLHVPLYRVRCEAIVGRVMGDTERGMGEIMDWLAGQDRCVVLFDEVEQIMASRQEMQGVLGRELNSAMALFWQYLDRWEAPTLFVLATNLPDRMDAALLSRIDLQLEFGPPTPSQASSVIGYWSEALHEFGGGEWGPELADHDRPWESFRSLFYAIQQRVRAWVVLEKNK